MTAADDSFTSIVEPFNAHVVVYAEADGIATVQHHIKAIDPLAFLANSPKFRTPRRHPLTSNWPSK